MPSKAVDTIINRLLNEPYFREDFAKDRERILRELPSDLTLTPAEEAALASIDVERLMEAASKSKSLAAAKVGSIYL